MKATVLADNIANGDMAGEWGLSIYIVYKEKSILLDTGASGLFIQNAEKLGINLREADYAVLSHAHYDHADGMEHFFEMNKKANFYLREGCGENCYAKNWIFRKYIGLPKHILGRYASRIVYAKNHTELFPGAALLSHSTEGLSQIGRKNHMYIKSKTGWEPDDFSHEQSLILEADGGIIIFNSCCHAGADAVIREAAEAYPGKKLRALVGGFHLYRAADDAVRELAQKIKQTGVVEIYTGHCTGDRPFQILREELGERAHQLKVGLTMSFPE